MADQESGFCFPVKRLENSRLILKPFELSKHADLYFHGTKDSPEHFTYVKYGPFLSTLDFERYYKSSFGSSNIDTCFAILAKSNPADEQGTFAGAIGLENASLVNASIEIGFVNIVPAFQRTFVSSNAIGLLLMYVFDIPPHGLGLRRCQWQTHTRNEASKRVATRMGFTFEGVQRFQRVLPAGKVGNGWDTSHLPRAPMGAACPSRDSAVFAYYCDEWPQKRDEVVAVMNRGATELEKQPIGKSD